MSMDTLIIMPVVMMARNIDFENPDNLLFARIAFAATQVLVIIAYFLLKSKIAAFNGDKKIKVKREPTMGEPAPAEGDMEEITEKEHDERELKKFLNQSLMQLGIMAFIHYQWGAAIPLVVQTVSTPLRLYRDKLVQLHLFGASGADYVRPFPPPPNPLAAFMGGSSTTEEPKTKKEKKKEKKEEKDD